MQKQGYIASSLKLPLSDVAVTARCSNPTGRRLLSTVRGCCFSWPPHRSLIRPAQHPSSAVHRHLHHHDHRPIDLDPAGGVRDPDHLAGDQRPVGPPPGRPHHGRVHAGL